MSEESFDGWAFLELMGHRRLAGYVTTPLLGGTPTFRIDIPHGPIEDQVIVTQWYAPAALYCLSPTTEEIARKWSAERWAPRPEAAIEDDPDAGHAIVDAELVDSFEPPGGAADDGSDDDGAEPF